MMDAEGREVPRLPKEKEYQVRSAIKKEIQHIARINRENIRGIAGGAAGGDILFHEICRELEIPSVIYLGLPADQFIQSSVRSSGELWLDRFHSIYHTLPVVEFKAAEYSLPSDHWEAVNHWMLQAAMGNGASHVSVLLLWDEARGDGGGGTSHMAAIAAENQLNITVINPHSLK